MDLFGIVVFLHFGKTLDTVSYEVLIDEVQIKQQDSDIDWQFAKLPVITVTNPAGGQSLVICPRGWYCSQNSKIFIDDLDDEAS